VKAGTRCADLVEETLGRGVHERLGRVHDFRRECGDHDAADPRVERRVELAEQPVLGGNLDPGRLHPRRVGERLGVAQHVATLCVTRHVLHALRDLDDRGLVAHVSQQRPGFLRRARIERVEHDA
jgi:hypothetical protein